MVDQRFHNISGPYKLSEIINLTNCQVTSTITANDDMLIHNIATLKEAGNGDLSFLSNTKYINEFKDTKASVCIVSEAFNVKPKNEVILLKYKNPYLAYTKLINLFYSRAKPYPSRIMPSSCIAPSAAIGKDCYIGHNVVIEDNAVIGDNCIIESGTFIDREVVIGNKAMIYSNVSISYSIIGNDVVILPGAKIGQDGFGFSTEGGVHHKIYHTGRVIIGNNVEIGANTTIDRGSMNDTIIEDLCRIDNLVQVGHNVKIGRGSIIVAQVGIAGSSEIGEYCSIGGQVGIAGHLTIGNMAQVAGKTFVMQNVESKAIVAGFPAMPIRDWHRQTIIMRKLLKETK